MAFSRSRASLMYHLTLPLDLKECLYLLRFSETFWSQLGV